MYWLLSAMIKMHPDHNNGSDKELDQRDNNLVKGQNN